MEILLLNPYYSQLTSYYSFYRPAAPFGLLYLAAYLRKHKIDSKVYELGVFDIKESLSIGPRVRFGASDKAIADIIRREKPKVVGITCMYSIYYRDVLEIAATIKRADPRVRVVLGGNHSSSFWGHILKDANVDFVVIGEGEETFLELTRKIINAEAPESVRGIAFRRNGVPEATNPRDLIADLDDIPYPAYDLVDYSKYLGEGNPFAMRPPAAGIVSSRGCPGQCVYCTVRAVWGRTWRGRSPSNVAGEIELLRDRYGVREIAFLDDSASLDKNRWEGICDEIIAKKLDIKWSTPNGIAHWTLTESVLDKMRAAGCYRVTFGIESAHAQTRKFLGKPYRLDQARALIRHANRIGLWTICTYILGFPYEEDASIRETVDFAKKSGTDMAFFYLLIPQPTSEVYGYFKKEGLLDFDRFFEASVFNEEMFEQINDVLNGTGCDTLFFKKAELQRLKKSAFRSFLRYRILSYVFHPWRLVWKVRSPEDASYILKMTREAAGVFIRTFNPLNRKDSDYLYVESKRRLNFI